MSENLVIIICICCTAINLALTITTLSIFLFSVRLKDDMQEIAKHYSRDEREFILRNSHGKVSCVSYKNEIENRGGILKTE
ncbi:MAG: hypothetical protein P1P63_08410 [Treponemataceae bacterium]